MTPPRCIRAALPLTAPVIQGRENVIVLHVDAEGYVCGGAWVDERPGAGFHVAGVPSLDGVDVAWPDGEAWAWPHGSGAA